MILYFIFIIISLIIFMIISMNSLLSIRNEKGY
nr:MAG TPA: hypothetical protein [Crassvirales sp.]